MLEILDIKKEETIAIGDDNNDLSMFEQVGYRVAVDNAIDIVKQKADEITLANDEDVFFRIPMAVYEPLWKKR